MFSRISFWIMEAKTEPQCFERYAGRRDYSEEGEFDRCDHDERRCRRKHRMAWPLEPMVLELYE